MTALLLRQREAEFLQQCGRLFTLNVFEKIGPLLFALRVRQNYYSLRQRRVGIPWNDIVFSFAAHCRRHGVCQRHEPSLRIP